MSMMYALQNIRTRIHHIKNWLDTQGRGGKVDETDMTVYKMLADAEQEMAEERERLMEQLANRELVNHA